MIEDLAEPCRGLEATIFAGRDRKSTRLNSSHMSISYAVFCLKKKNQHKSLRQYSHPRDRLTVNGTDGLADHESGLLRHDDAARVHTAQLQKERELVYRAMRDS